MRKSFIFILLISCFVLAKSQHKELVWGQFDFSQGNYILYGQTAWETPFNIELGDFYIDDINSLKQIQKQWDLTPARSFSPCGHDYDLRLVRNDTVVWYGEYNYECGWIMTEPWYLVGYEIDTLQGQLLRYRAKKMKSHFCSYKTLDSLRRAIDSLNKIENIYVRTSQRWLTHTRLYFYHIKFEKDSIPQNSKERYEEFKNKLSSILPKDKFYYEFKYELNKDNGDLYFNIEIWVRDKYELPELPAELQSDTIETKPLEYTLEWYER